MVCGAGAIEVNAPRVNDKRIHQESGQRMRFRSSILPPYVRRSPKVAEVLPLLYLHGLSGGDFVPALEEFFGSKAGLSATTIARLTEQWQEEREQFMARDLSRRGTTSTCGWTGSTRGCASARMSACAAWS